MRIRRGAVGAGLALMLAGCATTQPQEPPTSISAVGELRPGLGIAKGYLDPKGLPNSLTLLPAPPAAASAAQAADDTAFREALAASPERFAQAAADADLRWPQAVVGFEAILDRAVSGPTTPHTAMLVRRVMADAGLSTYAAKTHYKRTRPFVVNGTPTCTPADEAALKSDGSYPSGHAAIGWMLGMLFTDLAPERADALLKRGFDHAQSRVICRVHWQSDVAAGRLMASAVYARLQSDPVFRAQRDLARAELARAKLATPPKR
jgi:acid phosphatase (class A)